MNDHVATIINNLRANNWTSEATILENEFRKLEGQIASSDPDGKRARAAERVRIAGILNHAEASTRPTQAKALAFETDLAVETVGRILSTSPAEATGRRIPSIEERAAGLAEFGESFGASLYPSKTGAFDRAIETHNRNIKR